MTVDALETVIAWLRGDVETSALVDGRIANKHRYGAQDVWPHGQAGVAVRAETGPGEVYRPVLTAQVEIRCYAATPDAAMTIWLRVLALARETERVVIQTANGQALLYYVTPRAAAMQIHDDEVDMDVAVGVFEAMVYREALS